MDLTKLASYVDWILSWLPFNGDKTKIGGLLTVVLGIAKISPAAALAWLDWKLALMGVPVFIIGFIHKVVKKYLDANAPELLAQTSAKAVATIDPVTKQPETVQPLPKRGLYTGSNV